MQADAAPEVPDVASLGTVYDSKDENAVSEYIKNADWTTFGENLKNAGVPQSVVEFIASAAANYQ